MNWVCQWPAAANGWEIPTKIQISGKGSTFDWMFMRDVLRFSNQALQGHAVQRHYIAPLLCAVYTYNASLVFIFIHISWSWNSWNKSHKHVFHHSAGHASWYQAWWQLVNCIWLINTVIADWLMSTALDCLLRSSAYTALLWLWGVLLSTRDWELQGPDRVGCDPHSQSYDHALQDALHTSLLAPNAFSPLQRV